MGLVGKVGGMTLALALAGSVVYGVGGYFVPKHIKTRITDAQMAKVDDVFMIATEAEPFQNYDAMYRFKFNSGTIQNTAIRLKGKQVDIRAYGWRVPFFSSYKNVVGIKEIRESD